MRISSNWIENVRSTLGRTPMGYYKVTSMHEVSGCHGNLGD